MWWNEIWRSDSPFFLHGFLASRTVEVTAMLKVARVADTAAVSNLGMLAPISCPGSVVPSNSSSDLDWMLMDSISGNLTPVRIVTQSLQ